MDEDALLDMSDEELEAAFREAKNMSTEDPTPEPDDVNDNDTLVEDDPVEDILEEESTSEEYEEEEDVEEVSEEEETASGEEEEDADTSPEDAPKAATEETPEDKVAAPTVPERHTFRANGQEFSFTQEEIMKNFPSVFGQAMDYTKKMQAIKPWRKTIDALESASIGQEDLNLAIEVLKGTPEAIGEILKRHAIDPYELQSGEETPNYTPPDHGRDAAQLAIRDVIVDLQHDPDFSVTRGVLDKGGWDDSSWEFLTEDPERIRLLHQDVKSGLFQQAQGEMNKLRTMDRGQKPDYQYYLQAAQTIIQQTQASAAQEQQAKEAAIQREAARIEQERRAQVKEQSQRRAATTQAAAGRKAAAPAATRPKAPGPRDYLNASTEEFEDWYKSIMDNA